MIMLYIKIAELRTIAIHIYEINYLVIYFKYLHTNFMNINLLEIICNYREKNALNI